MSNVKTVVIKNVNPDVYIGSDKDLKIELLKIKSGEEVKVSLNTAKALFNSFPNNWSLVSSEGDASVEIELNDVLTNALTRVRSIAGRRGGYQPPSVKTVIKTVPGPSIVQEFCTGVREGKYSIEKIGADAISLIKVIPFTTFVSAAIYKDEIKLMPGEIGADIKKRIRYILSDKEGKFIDVYKIEAPTPPPVETVAPVAPVKTESEQPVVNIKKSKDIDPEEDLGVDSVIDELDKEDDDEKQSNKKRKPRRMKSEDDDEDDDD